MDLSGIIFVALALGWGVYLIPKALQHHEDLAKTRSVSTFSRRMRLLGSGQPTVTPAAAPETAAAFAAPVTAAAPGTPGPAQPVTRTAAGRAARRRRIVLLVLVFALGMVGTLTYFAIAPGWAPAIPAGLIVAFLITARLSVRRQQALRAKAAVPVPAPAPSRVSLPAADEETAGVDVGEIRAAARVETQAVEVSEVSEVSEVVAAPALADEGSLWDPLPITLPTYVTKPTARRTVRTIELTTTTSSGHSAADSKLAREAEAARKAEQAEKESAVTPEQRKAAGA